MPDKTALALMAQAARRAIADAGLTKDDIDGFGGHGTLLPPVEVSEYLGLRPSWVDATNVGGSSWEVMAGHAAEPSPPVRSTWLADVRINRAFRRQAPRTCISGDEHRRRHAVRGAYGATLIAKYAMAARRHMIEYGTTVRAIGRSFGRGPRMGGDERQRIRARPDHRRRRRRGTDAGRSLHRQARVPAYRRRRLGGAGKRASGEDCAQEPVWILGAADSTSHVSMSEWADFTTSAAALSGPRAFAQAGVGPADIDVCQLYDSFTSTVLLAVEDLGFCAKGEGGPFIASGALRPGGALPTNTDGGGLASCHPGMRGMFLMVEATRQLRGECGPRQVDDARLACVQAMGGFFTHSATLILGRQ